VRAYPPQGLLQVERDGFFLVLIDDQGTLKVVELRIGSLILDLGCNDRDEAMRWGGKAGSADGEGQQSYHASC
jgi:hypothetical protein